MLRTLGELALRAFASLGVALFPAWFPAEVRTPTDGGALALLALAFVAFVFAVGLGVTRLARVDRPSAALVALAVLALPAAAWAHRDEGGPLLRAAIWLTPLLWLAIATATSRVLLPRWMGPDARPRASVRRAAFVLPLAVGAALLFAARPRLASRAEMWRAAVAADPGNEPAALALAFDARRAGDAEGEGTILRGCATARAGTCRCADAFAANALDRDRSSDALETVARALEQCGPTAARNGMRAEALASLLPRDAALAADAALAEDPNEPHALYAKAAVDPSPEARRAYAVRAVEHGRGARANLQLGVLLLGSGDLDGAAAAFEAVLRASPADARATYDLALVAQRRGRYRDAREGYLRALALNPGLVDARYNLVVLTHAGGFDDEARHHLDKLIAADPRYPGILQATALLHPPAPTPPAPPSDAGR